MASPNLYYSKEPMSVEEFSNILKIGDFIPFYEVILCKSSFGHCWIIKYEKKRECNYDCGEYTIYVDYILPNKWRINILRRIFNENGLIHDVKCDFIHETADSNAVVKFLNRVYHNIYDPEFKKEKNNLKASFFL